jgi:hypothetical protein
MMQCPLCSSRECTLLAQSSSRPFILCPSCGLIFVPAEHHLAPEQEKVRYGLHQNSPDNQEYIAYLSKIADKVLELSPGPVMACDFGSGREHVLSDILVSRGARCVAHDPLYGMAAEAKGQFDMVVACESFEHLRNPRREVDFIRSLVKPGGFVYVHTQLYDDALSRDFSGWWYAGDPTHICFFCGKTMETVAEILGRKIIESNGKDTVVFGPR